MAKTFITSIIFLIISIYFAINLASCSGMYDDNPFPDPMSPNYDMLEDIVDQSVIPNSNIIAQPLVSTKIYKSNTILIV